MKNICKFHAGMIITSVLLLLAFPFVGDFVGNKTYAAQDMKDVHYHTPKYFSVPNGVLSTNKVQSVTVKDVGVNSWVLRIRYVDARIEDIRCKDKAEATFYLSKIRQQLVE